MRHLISIILLLALLTACRDAPGPDAADTAPAVTQTEQVTLTLAVEDSSLNRYQPLIEAFEQENPHIRVRLVTVSDVADPDESGIRALATSFDVFPYSPNRQGDSQYLLDLRPLRDLDPQFDTADFLPGLLPTPLESLWAVPTGAAYYLTFYDQSALAAAGLPHPDLEWTSDDFLAAALALTLREGDEVTHWGYVPGQMRYPPLLATQLTGPLTTPDGSLRLGDPDVVAAVQWLSDLFTIHEVSPWLEEYKPVEQRSGSGGQSALALIDSGMAAMWHTTHLLFDEDRENVGVTAVPHGPHGLAAEPIIYGFAASRGTAHPEAAWQLLHFLSRQPPQDAWAGLITPARRSVAAATNYWEQLPNSLTPALRYTAENSAAPRINAQVSDLLLEAFTAHIDDGDSVSTVLTQLSLKDVEAEELIEAEEFIVSETQLDASTLPTDDVVQITFATQFSWLESTRFLANQFQSEQPNIRVGVIERNEYASSRLERVASSDCFLDLTGSLDDDLRTAILPLGPLLDLDGSLQIDDFYPLAFSYVVHDGQVLGIPAGVSIPYIEYNRRLFQEADIIEPPMDWTLADFLEIAQQLTKGEGEIKQYGYAEDIPYLVNFTRNYREFGIQIIDYSTDVPQFDFEAATEMITWYADLIRLYEVQPSLFGSDRVGNAQRFEALLREEQVAMWPGGFADIYNIRFDENNEDKIGIVPRPIGLSGGRGQLSIHAYYILANSPNQTACWEWIKFLLTHPSATYSHSTTLRILPAHIKTAESEEYISLVGEEMADVAHAFVDSISTHLASGTPSPAPPRWMLPGFGWLEEAYQEVAKSETDVATALTIADTKFSQYRQCVIDNDAFEDPAAWNQCADSVR